MTDTVSIFTHAGNSKLLCVDDESFYDFYSVCSQGLVKETFFASSSQEGYQKFLDLDVDILIIDSFMPSLDGLEMIQKVRATNKEIPIILVSTVEDANVIIKALPLGINMFVKKPFVKEEFLEGLKNTLKLVLANNFLEYEKNHKQKILQEKESYNSYQEDLAFAKELNILRNDFYYQMIDSNGISLVDFLYQPLDIMSGDAYSARRVHKHCTFYFMIDGMGKGLSASLTAMIMTSFVNHVFDKMKFLESFDLSLLVHETIEFMKPILLEEEALSVDYIVIDYEENMMYYSKFAMPALLMQSKNNEILRLKSNNPPLCKYQQTFNVNSYDINNIVKFLIYSDGLTENGTLLGQRPYADFVEEDFLNSFTRKDFKNRFIEKIGAQEDDITLIFIHRLNLQSTLIESKIFQTSLVELEIASEWYAEVVKKITTDTHSAYVAELAFTELYMNAYEHGNLGIDSSEKNTLLEKDIFFETLAEKEKGCLKKITVEVHKVVYESSTYIMTQIIDEGKGFNTQILSRIFRNSRIFNGRGVFLSRKNSFGIYYNWKGNSVLYLNKI